MSASKPELYRWDRFTKPPSRVYSRSQRVTTDDDIQGWIKKVEVASENAAAEAFGLKSKAGKSSGKAAALATLENVHDHDAAYEEAQELLNQWMTEKLDLDDSNLGNSDDVVEESWLPRSKSQAAVKREWDHLVAQNEAEYGISSHTVTDTHYGGLSLYEADSNVVVGDILENLMKKDVVHGNILNDLGLEPQQRGVDPATKMKMRHEQVKENRLKRQQEQEKKHREQISKKEAEFQAKQIIKKEEKIKADIKRREEEQIQQHMAVIRRQRHADQQRLTAQKWREKQEKEESRQRIQAEYEKLVAMEASQKREIQTSGEERRRKIEDRLLQVEARNATENLKVLRGCFTAWYNILVERRLQMGRARALSEWKQMMRCWTAWRAHIRTIHLERETSHHQAQLTDHFRKEKMAVEHHKLRTLRKCMVAWQLYIMQCRQEKVIEQTQSETRNKMAAFLEAASSGRLWKTGEEDPSSSLQSIQESIDSTKNKLEELFTEQAKTKRNLDTARSDVSSSQASSRVQSSRSQRGRSQPKAAWQLTRKDIKVKHKGQGDAGSEVGGGEDDGDDDSSHVSAPASQRRGSKPWDRAPFMANNFEHRHQAQQKILEQQQKQLKEQQRLLEELQYLQRQQLLLQQVSSQPLPTNLQKHIDTLQQEVKAAGITPPSGALEQQLPSAGRQANDKAVAHNHLELCDLETDRDSSRQPLDSAMVTTERSDATLPAETGRTDVTGFSDNSTNRPSSNASVASTNSKHVAFLKGMGDRAAERARMKAEREAKRRQAETERLERLQAEEAERREQEEAEKQRRIEAHREKKRLEKQREIERQKEIEKQRDQMLMAEEHHRLALLRYRGWYPWQCLVTMAHERRKQAKDHYTQSLLRKVLLSWHHCVRSEVEEKEALADEHRSYLLVRRCFTNWKRVGEILMIQEQKAQRFYERGLKLRMVKTWAEYAEDEKIAMWHKMRLAKEHNLLRINKKYFSALRRYPKLRREEEERERRKAELRKKVASLLPDFEAPERKVNTSISQSFDFS